MLGEISSGGMVTKAYERLLNYVQYETASDETSDTCPSTPGQLEFGQAVVEEMQVFGIKDANMDETAMS